MALADSGLDTVRGLVLIALLFGFIGIWVWAWRKKRKPGFRAASLLPLEDDEVAHSSSRETKNGQE